MVGHGGSSVGSYLADPTSPIPSHCASIVMTSTVRAKLKLCKQNRSNPHSLCHFTLIHSCMLCVWSAVGGYRLWTRLSDDDVHVHLLCLPVSSSPDGSVVDEQLRSRNKLTLKVLVMTTDAQWEGMGDVGSARYESALLPPYQTIRVLIYSN